MSEPVQSREALRTFRATLCVRLDETAREGLAGAQVADRATGYFRSFGVTASAGEAASQLVELLVDDGRVEWRASEVVEIPDHKVPFLLGASRPEDLAAARGESEGIWYRSARVFF